MTRNILNREIAKALSEAGMESASFEAAELVCMVLQISKVDLLAHGDCEVLQEEEKQLRNLLQKRLDGYPLQYLIGEWDFYGYTFEIGEGVLIPRSDTEVLCEQVIRHIGSGPAVVLDLCSGSGCIGITISKECPASQVYLLEKSERAYAYLIKNIKRNQVQVHPLCMDALCFESINGLPDFDVIVSNPPYLSKEDMENLQREVCFEPQEALYGSDNGLLFYHKLTELWKNKLKPGGMLAYEIGIGQQDAVYDVLRKNGFESICETPDRCGIIRTICGVWPG